jgi:hypothetical protein
MEMWVVFTASLITEKEKGQKLMKYSKASFIS